MKRFVRFIHIYVLLLAFSSLSSCKYNDSVQSKGNSTNNDSSSQIVIERINDLYNIYILGGKEFDDDDAKEYLTTKLIKRLHVEYQNEYDGDGLAVWKFRTGYQDGPGSSSVNASSFDKNNNRATLKIMDMGYPATVQLFLVKEDDVLKIDSVIVNTDNK
ncbi:MAG: hypothetical protein MJZ19_12005 [Paludibacteraceae bacterium]|nr:hypothetical protein [Paludibacteraceae bacterium]